MIVAEVRSRVNAISSIAQSKPQITRKDLERVMPSGVQTYRTHERMVIPAYAGIQGVSLGRIPTGAMSPCIYSITAKLLILKHTSHFERIGHFYKKSRQELFACSFL